LNQLSATLVEGFRLGRQELLPAVDRLREEARSARKELADAQARLLDHEVQALLNETRPADEAYRTIVRAFTDRDATALKFVAKRLTEEPGVLALLGSHAGERVFLCFARSRDGFSQDSSHGGASNTVAPDMAALLRGALSALGAAGAKGGGSPEFAQGGAPSADIQQLEAALNWAKGQV
jgi:alanyl-tRNA synthetase